MTPAADPSPVAQVQGRGGKSLLVISQTFVPDPAAVGQHMTDVAVEMARRGHRVRVYASARGYENPGVKYPLREGLNGVDIRRLPLASFGKKNLLIRVLGTASFMVQCLVRGLFLPKLDAVFFSTSPPLVGVVAGIIGLLRRVPVAYWAMDLNPDQLIAMGKLKQSSLIARFLEAANRVILRRSALVVALDRFMAARLEPRAPGLRERMLVSPPWSQEDQMASAATDDQNPFRIRHGLVGKRVIMYSGNHSPSNPLTTFLQAAAQFQDDPELRFVFVGGGSGKREVERFITEHHPINMLSLPYQPLSELGNSLSAADVHVVTLGSNMVGIVHPCKIYGAMAVARPVLYMGPRPSHVSDLLDRRRIGWHVDHGDVEAAVGAIGAIKASDPESLRAMGHDARQLLERELSQEILCKRFCDTLEDVLRDGRPRLLSMNDAPHAAHPDQPVLSA